MEKILAAKTLEKKKNAKMTQLMVIKINQRTMLQMRIMLRLHKQVWRLMWEALKTMIWV